MIGPPSSSSAPPSARAQVTANTSWSSIAAPGPPCTPLHSPPGGALWLKPQPRSGSKSPHKPSSGCLLPGGTFTNAHRPPPPPPPPPLPPPPPPPPPLPPPPPPPLPSPPPPLLSPRLSTPPCRCLRRSPLQRCRAARTAPLLPSGASGEASRHLAPKMAPEPPLRQAPSRRRACAPCLPSLRTSPRRALRRANVEVRKRQTTTL
mmetsp:Transcript_35419/g.111177  ORF Transcript_35419/g.111177 Transcript_35419/m.111177 type:complete len:205 (-) Transcript_35419:1550-2164(-)